LNKFNGIAQIYALVRRLSTYTQKENAFKMLLLINLKRGLAKPAIVPAVD
jgi:hypothetical protein